MSNDLREHPNWDSEGFSSDILDLGRRLGSLAESGTADDLLVAELGTAYEELRAADEEIRAQAERIESLVADSEQLARQHERLVTLVPVPVLTTDRFGVVLAANPAAADLLGVRLQRLVGKPLATFWSVADRRELRRLLTQAVTKTDGARGTLEMAGPGGRPITVEAVVSPLPGQVAEITWLLLPAPGGPDRAPAARVAEALLQLTRLSAEATGAHELLTSAVGTLARVFPDGSDVSVCLGQPAEPGAVSTSSRCAQALDGSQLMAGQGPTAEAYQTGAVVVTTDLAGDPRWPALGSRLSGPRRAVVASPLLLGDDVRGVVTLYLEPIADLEHVRELHGLLTTAIGAALQELAVRDDLRTLATQMRTALESRAVIEQAKGIVMSDRRCGPEAAFQHLVSLSSSRHVKLRVLAEEIVTRTSTC